MKNPIETFFAYNIGLDSYDTIDVSFMPRISPYHAYSIRGNTLMPGAHSHKDRQNNHKDSTHSDDEDSPKDSSSYQLDPSMLEHYCYRGQLAHVVLLYAQGVSINRQIMISGTNATPLMWAALKGKMSVVKFLIDVGAGVNITAEDGQGPLHWAVNEGRLEMIEFLLQNHADPTLQDTKGFNAYTVAIQKESLAALLILHQHTAINIAVLDNDKHSYVHWAAYRGCLSILQFLHVVLGADLTTIDKYKRTALHWAAREGHAEICEYLMDNGISPWDVDVDGDNCIQHSKARNHAIAFAVLNRSKSNSLPFYLTVTGTVAAIAQSKWFALSALIGIMFPFIAWGVSLYIPPVLCYFVFSVVICKNVFFQYIIPKPIKAVSPEDQSIAAEVGVPTTLAGIFRGIWAFRRRDVANIFSMTSFICVQLIVISQSKDRLFDIGMKNGSMSSVKNDEISLSIIAESYLGQLFPKYSLIFLVMAVFFASMAKLTSFRSIIKPGPIETHPLFDAVNNHQMSLMDPHVIDADQNIRLPVRAFYCVELDRCFKKYDSWSLMLDCPIAASNHHYFLLFVLFMALYQASIWCTFTSVIVSYYCPAVSASVVTETVTSVGKIAVPASEVVSKSGFSASRFIILLLQAVLFNVLPCAEYIPEDASFMERYIYPTKVNILGVWVLLFGFCFTFSLVVVFLRQLWGVSFGYTRMEAMFPFVISDSGKMVHIFRKGGHTIYSMGIKRNLFLFFTGLSGLASEGLFAMPTPVDSVAFFTSHESECESKSCCH